MQKSLVPTLCFVVGCILVSSVGSARAGKSIPNEGKEPVIVTLTDQESMEGIQQDSWGKTSDGHEITRVSCTNKNGNVMELINYGATMVSLQLPDREGVRSNVLLTCPDMAGFEACGMYFNGIAGRYCNRIAKGRFSIDGREYSLATNNGENHLHGGVKGFDKRIWEFAPFSSDSGVGVKFQYTSVDGEEGYPGNLKVAVTYTLTHSDQLIIEIKAETDAPTHVNLTNHNYWNLAGSGDILGHELRLNCAAYIPVDEAGIPLGNVAEVFGTPFDFREAKPIGRDIGQLTGEPGGYDHCMVIDGEIGVLRPAARLYHPATGRWMEIETTEPGIQFYSGNFLDGSAAAGGYAKHSGLCLETEHYPDSPNQSSFPSTLLKPGDSYYHKTVHQFGVEK